MRKIGQQARLGAVLGPAGNTAISVRTDRQSGRRRPAIHFGVWFNGTGKYAALRHEVIPANGHWMDSNALYRNKAPFDSKSLKALPLAAKKTPIAVLFERRLVRRWRDVAAQCRNRLAVSL